MFPNLPPFVAFFSMILVRECVPAPHVLEQTPKELHSLRRQSSGTVGLDRNLCFSVEDIISSPLSSSTFFLFSSISSSTSGQHGQLHGKLKTLFAKLSRIVLFCHHHHWCCMLHAALLQLDSKPVYLLMTFI